VEWLTWPYPTGKNEIKNYYVTDYGNLLPPYIPGGEKWRIEVRYIKDGEVVGGYEVYGILRNQNSLMNGG
jgi:hypothetical protein